MISGAFHCGVVWSVCSGSQCLVQVPTNETFVKGSDVPSVILSAFQSVQHQKGSSMPDNGRCGNVCDAARQLTAAELANETQSSDRGSTTDTDSERCSRSHSSNTHAQTRTHWRPLLLVIPLRLGLSEINPVYFSAIKVNEDSAQNRILCHG